MVKYSVIIPLYNKGCKVKRAIDSVLKQNVNDLEIVVVDDGSTDDSVDYVKAYQDSRIRYIFKENGGVSSARNRGIKEAKGDWLLFLDADDEMIVGALGLYGKMAARHPHANLLVGQIQWRNNTDEKTVYQDTDTQYPLFHIWKNRIYPSPRNMVVARSLIKQVGNFDERQSFFEDLDFSLRLCRHGEVVYTNQITGIYHQGGSGLSESLHPVEKEMAYYIPEILAKGDTTFWERALLYENIEQEIAWWQGHPKELAFYRDMQRKHFAWYHKFLHWLRQQLMRHGIL